MAAKRSFGSDEDKEKQIARCTKCDTWKPFSEFTIIRHEPHRRNTQSSCKKCCREWVKAKTARLREEHRASEEASGSKECEVCKTVKPLSSFIRYAGNYYRDAYTKKCDACREHIADLRRKRKNRQHNMSWEKRYYTSVSGRAKTIISGVKARAGKQGIEFDLTPEWFVERFHLGCERTGLQFELSNSGIGKRNLRSPSVDRIDSQGHYTQDNCQLVILGYNLAKCDGTDEDVLIMAKALVRKQELKDTPACWDSFASCTG